MTFLPGALLAVALASGTGMAAGRPESGMLPPEANMSDEYVRDFREPPLWRPDSLRGYRSRMRLTIVGIALVRIAVRIDERPGGILQGRVVVIDQRRVGDRRRAGDDRIGREQRVFRVPRARMEALQAAMDHAELFRIHPQYWTFTDPEMMCMDGEELIFERIDARGYRLASANAQCTAPLALREVARMMLDLAGERFDYLLNLPQGAAR